MPRRFQDGGSEKPRGSDRRETDHRPGGPKLDGQAKPAATAEAPAQPPATEFYLPYQFVPVTGKVQGKPTQIIPWDQVESGQDTGGRPSPTRHDLWLPGTHSGRILCRLELVTPTFVGTRQVAPETEGCAKTVEHYQRHGDRAIPANSLRGMIGSVAEGLSQSTLRVLEDRHYSVRKPMRDKLPRQGMIEINGGNWLVRPDGPVATAIPIPEPVLQTFSRLWVDRVLAEQSLHGGSKPSFFPKAFRKFRPSEAHFEKPDTWRPQAGMPVFFVTRQAKGGQPEVTEISFSAIWRKEVEGTSFDFFRNIDPNLVPWGNHGRTHLTPAEALFGVVEDRPERARACGKNLASRLRFHDALPEYGPGQTRVLTLGEVKPLRILASPKPPSPALYFEPGNNRKGHISKTQLGKGHRPKGRKHYLHLPKEQTAARWWESRESGHADQKLCCDPTRDGQAFWFHIDFDNLTDAELTLLCAALEPDPGFQHRLGLGKPLGLGSVELSIQAALILDTDARYSRASLAETARYHQAHVPDPSQVPAWPARYAVDIPGPGEHGYPPLHGLLCDPSLIDADTLAVLARLGDPGALKPGAWVHHPLIAAQLPNRVSTDRDESEDKTYAWHVQNEKVQSPNALPPVEPGERYLPTLPV